MTDTPATLTALRRAHRAERRRLARLQDEVAQARARVRALHAQVRAAETAAGIAPVRRARA